MSIEFALLLKETPFGLISDPRIPIGLPTSPGLEVIHFRIDTGADFSVAPRRFAEFAGPDWETLPDARIAGVGHGNLPVRIGRLPILVSQRRLTIQCFFVDSRRLLLLLGRTDFLDRFVFTIDQPRRRIILDEVDS